MLESHSSTLCVHRAGAAACESRRSQLCPSRGFCRPDGRIALGNESPVVFQKHFVQDDNHIPAPLLCCAVQTWLGPGWAGDSPSFTRPSEALGSFSARRSPLSLTWGCCTASQRSARPHRSSASRQPTSSRAPSCRRWHRDGNPLARTRR